MMDINELAIKVGGEVVGGRVLATVEGKKVYLTNIGDGGAPILNDLGLKISNELPAAEPVVEESAPKRGRRKAEAPAIEPEQLELDI